jgi:hypothetical protein
VQNSEFVKRPAKQLGVLRTFSLEVMQIFKNFKGNKSRLATFPKEKRVFGFKFEVRKTASPQRAAHCGNLPHIFKGKRQRLAISRTEKQKKMQERGRHTPSSGIQCKNLPCAPVFARLRNSRFWRFENRGFAHAQADSPRSK